MHCEILGGAVPIPFNFCEHTLFWVVLWIEMHPPQIRILKDQPE